MAPKPAGMSIRILDKEGAPIAKFDEDEFAPDLRKALLALYEKHRDALFIDVEFNAVAPAP